MKSEWRVTANLIGGEMKYGAYRLRDVNEIDHSGNRETSDRWFNDREIAEDVVRIMNEAEEDS